MADRGQGGERRDQLNALSAVLEAEREMAEHVQEAFEAAARMRNAARAAARAIEARADRRVQALHGAVQARNAERKTAREAAFAREKAREGAADPQALSRAAAAGLARRITGVGSGQP